MLVRGGTSISETSEGFASKATGEDGLLYRIAVRAASDSQGLLAHQRPIPLFALSRLAEGFGGIAGGTSLSPDGRWILSIGMRQANRYWCATGVDGRAQVVWPMNQPTTRPRGQTLPAVALSDATWLPDSSGILEMTTEWDWVNTRNATVAGHIRHINSPDSSVILPSVSLGRILDSQYFEMDLNPVRVTNVATGQTSAMHCILQTPENDPNLFSGGPLQSRPPDQVIVYRWDWRTADQRSPRAQTEVIAMPLGYSLFAKAVSARGDRAVFALMDRAHHYVVSTGGTIHPRHGDGKISLWTCEMSSGRAGRLQERCRFVVPFGKEAWCYQRFALGDWFPGNQRFSFQFGSRLYTVAVA